MHQTMLFIEADDVLYRGFGQRYPSLTWQDGNWTICDLATPQPANWGELVSVREAERLYPGATTAAPPQGVETTLNFDGDELARYRPELFDGYDGPMYRLSPDEEAERSASWRQTRGHIANAIAEPSRPQPSRVNLSLT